MKKFKTPIIRTFVIECASRALVAFEAGSRREAEELRKEQWFRDELASLRSNGEPIWDCCAMLEVRNAEPSEVAKLKNAAKSVEADSDEIVMAYLVPLDGPA